VDADSCQYLRPEQLIDSNFVYTLRPQRSVACLGLGQALARWLGVALFTFLTFASTPDDQAQAQAQDNNNCNRNHLQKSFKTRQY
jgi:hypothetical protein